MVILIQGKTNHDYCMVNTAKFHLKDGGVLTIDRKETEYSIENGEILMRWKGVYLWAINGEPIANECVMPNEKGLTKLLQNASLELELEDDAPDEDYEITDLAWTAYSDVTKTETAVAHGTGYNF